MIVKIPRVFAEDHEITRDIPSGKRLDENSRYVIYDADQRELDEWLNDAIFYADRDHWSGEYWYRHEGGRSICRSAERAVPLIEKALNA